GAVNSPATITGSYNNPSLGVTVTVLPPPPPAELLQISFSPNTVTGGTAAQFFMFVTSPAGPGGFTATLSANVPNIVTLPPSATVPQGQTEVSFSVPTATVTVQTGLTVFATAGGLTQLAPLFVNPAAPPPPPPPSPTAPPPTPPAARPRTLSNPRAGGPLPHPKEAGRGGAHPPSPTQPRLRAGTVTRQQ